MDILHFVLALLFWISLVWCFFVSGFMKVENKHYILNFLVSTFLMIGFFTIIGILFKFHWPQSTKDVVFTNSPLTPYSMVLIFFAVSIFAGRLEAKRDESDRIRKNQEILARHQQNQTNL